MLPTPAVRPSTPTPTPSRSWTLHGALYLRAAGRVGARYRTVVGADVAWPGGAPAPSVGRAVVSLDADPAARRPTGALGLSFGDAVGVALRECAAHAPIGAAGGAPLGATGAAHATRFAAWPSPRGPGLATLAAALVTDAPPFGLDDGDLVLSGSCRVTAAAWSPGDAEAAVAGWLAMSPPAAGGC